MLLVPDALPTSRPVSRRSVLLGTGRGLLGLALVGVTAAACGTDKPAAPDTLLAPLAQARADAAMATAAAAALPALAAALTQIATEREAHARALADEIGRVAGTALSSTTTSTTTTAAEPSPPTRRDVVAALRSSAEAAADLAVDQSGYRAGLLGSIAAACTASYLVGLPEEPKP